MLLAELVGVGFLVSAGWQWRSGWHTPGLSIAAGSGLVLFKFVELALIGFQPLQLLFTLVGLAVIALSRRPA